jgi:hypothetical protein
MDDVSIVAPCAAPPGALLTRLREAGAYTDCYATQVPWRVSHADFVEAFYTTGVFSIERWLLARFGFPASTDIHARRLATGEVEAYSAWKVEARTANQLLLRDHAGRTRSWLMVETTGDGGFGPTQLYFGSAVVPVVHARSGKKTMGSAFAALLSFHKLYSRVLLHAARARLARKHRDE